MIPSPKAAGFHPEALERISDSVARDYVDPGKYAGAQITISRKGQLAYARSFGFADLARGKQTADDTIYRIYSMSKPVTAVALLSLYERGCFQLTDAVCDYIPAWRDQRVWLATNGEEVVTEPIKRPVTILDLLRHTAGLVYGEGDHPVDDIYRATGIRDLPNPDSAAVFLDKLGRTPLIYQPGEKWGYSIASDVCGALVEHFSGQRFGDYLDETVFRPLGMRDTSFAIAPEKVDRLAANYRKASNGALDLIDDPPTSEFLDASRLQSGGGGLLSTSADYLRFCEMLRRRGRLDGERILGPRTVELMTQNHLPAGRDLSQMTRGYMFRGAAGEGLGHGLGVAVRLRDPSRGFLGNGDYSWGGAASTVFWIDPREDLIVIVMAQLMPSTSHNLAAVVRSLVYAAIDD